LLDRPPIGRAGDRAVSRAEGFLASLYFLHLMLPLEKALPIFLGVFALLVVEFAICFEKPFVFRSKVAFEGCEGSTVCRREFSE